MMMRTLRQQVVGCRGAVVRRGFTLVELLIAMSLLGLLTVLIYGMFVRTSDALQEVDGLSDALDQARFGMDYLRNDMKMAGAQSTPNSDPRVDRSVTMEEGNRYTIHGVMGYDNWQEQSHQDRGGLQELDTSNPGSQFSGIVVTGAYNVPSIFFSQLRRVEGPEQPISQDELVVAADGQGLGRFRGFDPFDRAIQPDAGRMPTPGNIDLDGRMLRVIDTDGQKQFLDIDTQSDQGGDLLLGGLDLIFEGQDVITPDNGLKGVGPGNRAGFSESVEDDVDLDTALIDAYWYYVTSASGDDRTMQLVRQQVDLPEIAVDDLRESDLDGNRIGPRMVIAENVVDLRIWFDCVNSSGQWVDDIDGTQWDIINDNSNCITDSAQNSRPERARYANIRLSTRTEGENSNRPHLQVSNVPGFEDEDGRMQTYEVVEAAEGSASVVTLQTGVELTNFSILEGN